MRAIKRLVHEVRADWLIRPRRAEVTRELERHLGGRIRLRPRGARGRDTIYRVDRAGVPLGVLRLANPHRRRAQLERSMPFRWIEDDRQRIAREHDAFAAGAPSGLTPRPLWQCGDALLVEHVRLPRGIDLLRASPGRFWPLNIAVTTALARLHRLGFTHMDASLANALVAEDLSRVVLIDFEYGPAPDLSSAEQRLYDHLRLLESGMKFMPETVRGEIDGWVATLGSTLDSAALAADVARLRPALGRLLGPRGFAPELACLVPALGER
ncbi:MAG: hypothetical protein H6982_03855 [Chromatiales bacterium]|nr:hypothetical protein [Chromatiales bacterium]